MVEEDCSVHLEVTADEELTRHDCGVVGGCLGEEGIETDWGIVWSGM